MHTTTAGKVKFSVALDPDAYELLQRMISGPRSAGGLLSNLIRLEATQRQRSEEELSERERPGLPDLAKDSAHQEMRGSAARSEALLRTAHKLNAQLSLPAVLSAVCEEATRALAVPGAFINLYDPDRRVLDYATDFGMPPEFGRRYRPSPRPLYDEYTRRMGPLLVFPDVQALVDIPNAELYAALDIRTVANAALERRGELIGILSVVTFGESRGFSQDELSLLRNLAGQAASAIANARLHERLRAELQERTLAERRFALQTQRLQVLQEIDRAILAKRTPAEIAETASRALCEATAARRVVVQVFDLPAGEREVLACFGPSGLTPHLAGRHSLESYWVLEDNLQGRVGVIPDLAALPGKEDVLLAEVLAGGVRGFTGVPLIVSEEIIGALALGHADPGLLSDDMLQFTRQVADRLALGVQSARLNEQVLASQQQLLQREASLRVLSHRLVELQEEERRNLSRELHDRAGQSITALKLQLSLLGRAAECAPAIREGLDELRAMADAVMTDLHELAVGLRPSSLDRYGLLAALEQLMASFRKQNAMDVQFVSSGLHKDRLAGDVETTLYRITQESLTNISRHAQAKHVDIVLSRTDDTVALVVEDDGRGFDVDEALARGRLGLLGMRERAEMLGGTLAIESAPGAGTVLYVQVPLRPTADGDHLPQEQENSLRMAAAISPAKSDLGDTFPVAEAELGRAKALGDALNDLYAEIAALHDPYLILERAVVSAGAAIGCDVATVMTPDNDGWLMRSGYRLPEVFHSRHYSLDECPPYVLHAARTQEVLVVDNCRTDERFTCEQADRFGVHAGIVVPILLDGEVAAALTFAEYSQPRHFTPAEVDFARRLKTSLSLTVENAHLHQIQARQRGELAQRVEELQSLLELLPVGIGIAHDRECMTVQANRALAEMLAMPQANVSAKAQLHADQPAFRVFQDGRELRPDELPMQMAAAHGAAVRDMLTEVVRRDGTTLFLLGNAVPLFDATGELRGAIGAFVDVTEQRAAQAETEEARRSLQALLDYIPEGITIADGPDVCIRYVSRYGQDLLGGAHEEQTAAEFAARWPVYEPDGVTPIAEADLPLVRAIRYGETVRDRAIIQETSQGRRVSLLCNAGPIRDREGRVTGGIVAWRSVEH